MYTCIRTFQISQLVMVLCSTIVQLSKQKRTKISRHSRRISVLAFGLCLTHFTWKFFKQCICMLSFCHNCFPILTKCQHSLTFYIHRGTSSISFHFHVHLNFNLASSLLPLFTTRMAIANDNSSTYLNVIGSVVISNIKREKDKRCISL